MAEMTKQDWEAVAASLANPYSVGAEFLIDGHKITARVERLKGLKYVVVVYIDGFLKGEHYKADSELGKKFYLPRKKAMFTAKQIADIRKMWGKREANKDAEKAIHWNTPFANTFAPFRKHWAKTCSSIELVRAGYAKSSEPEVANG